MARPVIASACAALLACLAASAVRAQDDEALNALRRGLRVLGFQSSPAPVTSRRADFRIVSAVQDWAKATPDLCCHTLTPIRIGTQSFKKGIGAHANGRIVVELVRPYKAFRAAVGIDNNADTGGIRGSAVFIVKTDGVERVRTPICRGGEEPRAVEVDLRGVRQLELIVTDAGDGISYDQSDWADAQLVTDDGKPEYVGDALSAGFAPPYFSAPFTTFQCDGKPCWQVFAGWQRTEAAPRPVRGGTRYEQTWRDPQSGFEATLHAVLYDRLAGLEIGWHLAHHGQAPGPLITDLLSVDVHAPSSEGRGALISCSGGLTGDFRNAPERLGFELSRAPLGEKTLGVNGGRSSNGDLPFFMLRDGPSGWGLAAGLGWSGQWSATARFDKAKSEAALQAGMQPVHFRLAPEQSLALPTALLIPFRGSDAVGANCLRRLLRGSYQALLGGKPCPPPVSFNSWFTFDNRVDAALLCELADAAAPLGIEYFCLDSGWFDGDFPAGVGNWTVSRAKFPNGLKAVADHVHSRGMKFGLWFEPERVAAGTRWAKEHPDLVLGDLLDLGKPEAQELVLRMVDDLVSKIGVDWIRYDFNTDPLGAWTNAEGPEQKGLRQIMHINGLYRVWDELMRRHPNLLIEQCSSGGRRIDLETIRRGHTFWKSDDTYNQPLMRFHETGANFFLPGGLLNTNLCQWRSQGEIAALFAGPLGFGLDFRKLSDTQKKATAQTIAQYKRLREFIDGDYYPLFPQSTSDQTWNGWEFIAPDRQEGFFAAYRPASSPYGAALAKLSGLDEGTTYRLVEVLTDRTASVSGKQLAAGWSLNLAPDEAQVWRFARK